MDSKLKEAEAELPSMESRVAECSTLLEQLHQRKRDTYAFRQTRRSELAQASEALHECEREDRRLTESAGRLKEREHEVTTCLAEYNAGIEALIRERQSKTLGELSPEEHRRVAEITTELRELTTNLTESEEVVHKLHRDLRGQEQHLNGYLRRRFQEVEAELLKANQQDHLEQAQERERAVERLKAQVEEIEAEMQRLSSEMRVE